MKEEKALLIATRDRLRQECQYSEGQCEIEFDELAPGVVADTYILVSTGGFRPGRHQTTSGTVRDYVYGVNVTPIKRIRAVPRDRFRDVFLNNLDALAEEIEKITDQIDWSYELMTAVNAKLAELGDAAQGFVEPLKFASVDQKPRLISPDVFAATGQQAAGMARTIHFFGARRIRTVNID
jgi:hypothetical protein